MPTADLDTPIPYTLPPLSTRQLRVLNAICTHWREYGRSPTIRELQIATGIASPNGIACHLIPLQRKGYIEREEDSARGIWPAGLRASIRDLMTPTEETT